MPYKQNGTGTLWVPNKHDDINNDKEEKAEKADKLVESLKESAYNEAEIEEPWLGGYNNGDFQLEELYVDSHQDPSELVVNGNIDDVFIGINIPIKNNDQMQKVAEQINKVVTIDKESSGLYLKPKDFTEVRTRKADPQGRINLGKDYADREVRVVVLDE